MTAANGCCLQLTAQSIIEGYRSGDLLSQIVDRFSEFNDVDMKNAATLCAEMHNQNEIDILIIIDELVQSEIGGPRFFLAQHFLSTVIPKLEAPIDRLMHCISGLVEKGGEDLAASQPNAAFREWCQQQPGRVEEVIKKARFGDKFAIKLLTFALASGSFVEEAVRFVQEYSDNRRIAGVVALGRMPHNSPESALAALSALRGVLEKNSDAHVSGNALLAALDLSKDAPSVEPADWMGIIRAACRTPTPEVQFCCARALWLHHKMLDHEAVEILLSALVTIDPEHKGILRELDNGLRHLLSTSEADLAIQYVRQAIESSGQRLELSDFEGFARALIQGPTNRFHKVVVCWLLSGDASLCTGISDFLRRSGRANKPLYIDGESLDLTPTEFIFLSRKAIGYLFIEPVVAGSILVSILRVAPEDVAVVIRGLLVEPLLANYAGELREYLEGIDQRDPAYPHVQEAIVQNDRYLSGLETDSTIKELLPSEYQRQIERVQTHLDIRRAQKSAEKGSVLLGLIKRSVVLYGKRTVTYIGSQADPPRRVEMDLKEFSVSFPVPRMETTDPVGLEYMLRVFRAERLRR